MANFVSPNQIHNQIGWFFWFGTILETIRRNLTDRRGQGWKMERNDRHHNCHARMSPLVHGEITDRPSDENPRGRGERDAACLSDRLRDAVMREGCTACRSKMNGVCLASSSVLSYGRSAVRSVRRSCRSIACLLTRGPRNSADSWQSRKWRARCEIA